MGDVATYREIVETGAEAGEYEDTLTPGNRQVGLVTSSAWGPSVGKTLALAYVDTAHAWPGGNLIVEVNGRSVPAKVAQTPFFDPEMARARSRPQDDQLRKPQPSPAANSQASVPAGHTGNGRA
ncbi:MAG: Aminomethyltransferase [uncultured Rubrobacteraceae bacterium]|uniref:Aminomethyltransferase n=1 Tax=uncultured Rubrobacteraceae bacterium TaxID=349277 RepID=A0A6J4R3I1_9ACTN|nr:MAG: Aminomethyltransferase [uncultured Rubrobacteraceae bacterium]